MFNFSNYAFFAALIINAASVQATEYTAHSPANRVALLELYTSEGCSSCPPADDWLAKTGAKADANLMIPLALHVDYWDSLGWKDPFGDHKFTLRQQQLAAYMNSKLVYTPEIFVAGRELRHWSAASAFDEAVKKITSQPSLADIDIKLSPNALTRSQTGSYDLSSSVKLRGSSLQSTQIHQAYVAIYENKLISNVAVGENGGVTLHHDYVVRSWLGPFALKDGAVQIKEKIALDKISPTIKIGQFGVVVFVQNGVNGEVLQATRLQPGTVQGS